MADGSPGLADGVLQEATAEHPLRRMSVWPQLAFAVALAMSVFVASGIAPWPALAACLLLAWLALGVRVGVWPALAVTLVAGAALAGVALALQRLRLGWVGLLLAVAVAASLAMCVSVVLRMRQPA